MSFEGQKEGFAPIRVKPARGRSGVISASLFYAYEVANPKMITKGEIVVPTKKTATMTSLYETSVE